MQPTLLYTSLGKYAVRRFNTSDALQYQPSVPTTQEGRISLLKRLQARYKAKDASVANPSEEEVGGLDKLKGIVEKSHHTLAHGSAVFPFDLFPDTITIDRKKLTVVHRAFFNIEQTVGVQLSDVTNVQANVGPFFGTLTVTSEHFINNMQVIKWLPRRKAIEIQRLLQGMIIAQKEHVDIDQIEDENELKKLLNELGQGETKK